MSVDCSLDTSAIVSTFWEIAALVSTALASTTLASTALVFGSRSYSTRASPPKPFRHYVNIEYFVLHTGGCRYFFDGTYADFSKFLKITTHPPPSRME